jgi:N-acetylneuraminic acid mutarotase
MGKSAALLLVLFFMVASCIAVKPALSSADDSAENSWVSKKPMQQARSSLGVAAVNGKIYAIGGYAENGVVGTNEEYDPATGMWTCKSSTPTPMGQFATVAYQNMIYCISGNVNEVYDPETDTWETREPMPTPRSGVGANVVHGKIYVTGGYVPNSSSLTGSSFVSLNEVYNPETDSWTTKAEVPTAVVSSRSAVVDSKIYIIQNDLTQIYDAVTDTWSVGTPLPHSSGGFKSAVATAGVYAPKRIYVFGGGITQVYDPETDS